MAKRSAAGLIKDLRKNGRSDDQIRIVARVTHDGTLQSEVERLLSMSVDEAAALAPEDEAPPPFNPACVMPVPESKYDGLDVEEVVKRENAAAKVKRRSEL